MKLLHLAHFGLKSALRTHRMNIYGSFTMLDFTTKLHSSDKTLLARGYIYG